MFHAVKCSRSLSSSLPLALLFSPKQLPPLTRRPSTFFPPGTFHCLALGSFPPSPLVSPTFPATPSPDSFPPPRPQPRPLPLSFVSFLLTTPELLFSIGCADYFVRRITSFVRTAFCFSHPLHGPRPTLRGLMSTFRPSSGVTHESSLTECARAWLDQPAVPPAWADCFSHLRPPTTQCSS